MTADLATKAETVQKAGQKVEPAQRAEQVVVRKAEPGVVIIACQGEKMSHHECRREKSLLREWRMRQIRLDQLRELKVIGGLQYVLGSAIRTPARMNPLAKMVGLISSGLKERGLRGSERWV